MGEELVPCSANYVPLSPISFLERAATAYGDKVSVIYGDHVRFSWAETYQRCVNLASALVNLGVSSQRDIVAALAPNIPALYELHFGVPMAGAVLSALNTKLDVPTLALILEQLESCKIMFVDYQFIDSALKAVEIISQRKCKPPLIVLIPDYGDQNPSFLMKNIPPNTINYNDLIIAKGHSNFEALRPRNGCDPISVNYTSGSTGTPKGVIYSHRGAYLNSLASIDRFDMKPKSVLLWTVDMFRCNGWCLTWAMSALGGTNVCLRDVSAKGMFDAIHLHKVTHLCGAPILLNIIADSLPSEQNPLPLSVKFTVAGVLPPFQVLNKVSELGFDVNIGYGMTEALGPVIVRPWKPNSDNEHTKLNYGEEGLPNFMMEGVDVKDPRTMKSVPYDGKTIGEIMFKGNTLMLGYLKNSQANEEALRGGWYRTGDLAVRQPNGSVTLKDRAKDMIYSRGAAVSSLEEEAVLLSHPKVLKAAVVGKHDDLQEQNPSNLCHAIFIFLDPLLVAVLQVEYQNKESPFVTHPIQKQTFLVSISIFSALLVIKNQNILARCGFPDQILSFVLLVAGSVSSGALFSILLHGVLLWLVLIILGSIPIISGRHLLKNSVHWISGLVAKLDLKSKFSTMISIFHRKAPAQVSNI